MRQTAVVVDPRFEQHDAAPGHPERPARCATLRSLIDAHPYDGLPRVSPRPATAEEVLRVHSREHLEVLEQSAGRPHTRFDADTAACAASFDVAMLAAGGAIELADTVLDGGADNGVALIRPPGHHAERDRPMGFCLLNNVAIVARHLTAARGLDRVLIVDWDVHHGNGTQHCFEDASDVLYASLHQYPYYPGTGRADEIGIAAGEGYTVNLPMTAGSGPAEYLAAFERVILPVTRAFRPDFVLVSAGFDAHRDDPLASIRLDEETFAAMTDALLEVADSSCQGRLVALLEGGYELNALSASLVAVLEQLAAPQPFDGGREGELSRWGETVRASLSRHWDL